MGRRGRRTGPRKGEMDARGAGMGTSRVSKDVIRQSRWKKRQGLQGEKGRGAHGGGRIRQDILIFIKVTSGNLCLFSSMHNSKSQRVPLFFFLKAVPCFCPFLLSHPNLQSHHIQLFSCFFQYSNLIST